MQITKSLLAAALLLGPTTLAAPAGEPLTPIDARAVADTAHAITDNSYLLKNDVPVLERGDDYHKDKGHHHHHHRPHHDHDGHHLTPRGEEGYPTGNGKGGYGYPHGYPHSYPHGYPHGYNDSKHGDDCGKKGDGYGKGGYPYGYGGGGGHGPE
ncbi:hypothetical protein F5X99DRAFT_409985 [Biscogniauxia marginata]|nr:hypothetical protein F5X99DRAFT_409985 [Biscogniauxia marginata]